ncbi:MAG: hypothetical protein HY667_02045 [Chloroflexi bacterium]|nr:hypothetical protein [Chloroflexota bacterium]
MAQYAQIVEIVAPSQAVPGDLINVTVRIKNLYSAPIGIMVGGALEYGATPWPGISFPANSANVDAGAIWEFSGYFYMPDKGVTIHAYSYWYGADGLWYLDDEKTRSVSVTTLTPQISEFRIADFNKV